MFCCKCDFNVSRKGQPLTLDSQACTHACTREGGMDGGREVGRRGWKQTGGKREGRQTDRNIAFVVSNPWDCSVFYISTHGRNVRSKSTSTSLGSNYSGILIEIPSPPYLPPPSLSPFLPPSHPPSLHIDVTSGVSHSSICMRPTNI